MFGRFYDYSLSPEDEEKLIAFDNFFEQYNLNENGIFDTNKILKSVKLKLTNIFRITLPQFTILAANILRTVVIRLQMEKQKVQLRRTVCGRVDDGRILLHF